MNISLPDDLSAWADTRVAQGRFGDSGEYVRELVRRDRDDEEKLTRLKAAIDEGLASGVSERDPFEYIAELRAGLRGAARSADAA